MVFLKRRACKSFIDFRMSEEIARLGGIYFKCVLGQVKICRYPRALPRAFADASGSKAQFAFIWFPFRSYSSR